MSTDVYTHLEGDTRVTLVRARHGRVYLTVGSDVTIFGGPEFVESLKHAIAVYEGEQQAKEAKPS